jgi:flavin-dependent dehydrogenase
MIPQHAGTLDEVNNIVIVGGGSAGWIVASTLINDHPNKKITLIESQQLGNITVGESTVNDINPWLDHLGINRVDFLRNTDGVYKYATGFTNFYSENSETFFTHFGMPISDPTAYGPLDWFVKKALYPETKRQDYFESYIPQSSLVLNNRMLDTYMDEMAPFQPSYDVAYQVNGLKLGSWLAESYAKPRGVIHIEGKVVKVNGDDSGVTSLLLEDGSEITADLFVDCSGFKSMLLGEFLGEEFNSTKYRLPHNKAYFAPIEYTDKEKELQLFTNCYGLKNGWAWNTPLWSRIGSGYTYSDEFIDDDAALQEFKDHLNSKNMLVYDPHRSEKMNFRLISAKNGYYDRVFVKNVFAIGLSAGFLDPLEGSGLYHVQSMSTALSHVLLKEKINLIDKAAVNEFWRYEINATMKFIETHFIHTTRSDSEYWIKTRNKIFTPEHALGLCNDYRANNFSTYGVVYTAVAAGMNVSPINKFKMKQILYGLNLDLESIVNNNLPVIENKKKSWKAVAENLPTHFEYLKKNIHY